MEALCLIAGLGFVVWMLAAWFNPHTTVNSPTTSGAPQTGEQLVDCPHCHQRNRLKDIGSGVRYRCAKCQAELPNPFGGMATSKPDPGRTFRPSQTASRDPAILFRDSSLDNNFVSARDLSGLVDAFTGEALNSALGLFQCGKCEVYYHRGSLEVIRSENDGKCVACLSTSIRAVSQTTFQTTPHSNVNYRPNVVTLGNYRDHVGRVITFEGYVPKVLASRRGTDFAVMFENKGWVAGLKMVVFRGKIREVGGQHFIRSLENRTIRVRGLLQNHPTFGYEIIVSERSMIQQTS